MRPDQIYSEEFFRRQLKDSGWVSAVLFGAALLALTIDTVRYAFFERPAIMRVIEKGRRVDAQLVQCHIEKSKNPANDKYAVDYHWTDRQGVVQSVNGQKVPGKEVYVKICYGKLAPFGILVLDDEPALQPVIEVSKEVLSKGNFWGRAGTGLLLLFATLLGLTYTQIDQRKQRDES